MEIIILIATIQTTAEIMIYVDRCDMCFNLYFTRNTCEEIMALKKSRS